MRVDITRTTPIYAPAASSGVFVQWTLVDIPDGSPAPWFRLETAEAPTGPFDTVVDMFTEYHYFDQHVVSETLEVEARGSLSLQRARYYRVTATAGAVTAQATATVGDQLPRRQYLLRRKIQRDIAVGFRVGNGIALAVLKRRHWGRRCPQCFDATTKAVSNGRCTVCYGTSYLGGYYTPVKVSGRKGTTNVSTQIAPQGKVEINQIELTVLDYPQIDVDDVIVEERTDRRYCVRHVTRTELRGVPVHQKLVMSEIPRDAVEYAIPISSGTTPTLY